MTFYNPLFPPFFRFPMQHSTNYKKPVESACNNNSSNIGNNCDNINMKNDSNNCNTNRQSNCQEKNNCNMQKNQQNLNNCNKHADSHYEKKQKNNCKKPLDIGLFYNYLQEPDTLIIIALLYFLYQQDSKDYSLMLCLFLLLFD